jgi:hypothetical protein
VRDSALFPYKSRPECYSCYEKVTGTTLHAFRQKVNRQKKVAATTWYKCSSCDSIHPNWSGRCPACGEWSTLSAVQSNGQPPVAKKSKFSPEVSREYVVQYLQYRAASNQPIKIYYKDDRTFRIFYSYTFDDTYLHIPSTKGYTYKYLIDKIRNVEL